MPSFEDHDTRPMTEAEIEAEVKRFAAEEALKMGLERKQYTEKIHTTFTRSQRAHTTMLVSGLTLMQDTLVCAGLRGLGYQTQVLDIPDNNALNFGKEFGNRGQCNPTYYTVGNLVKYLTHLRDEEGLSTEEIIKNYLFITAGACGPCRFGMYVTEFRKALRDSGFDGFRVMLFQQQGGLKQATGEELGLEINGKFALALVGPMLCGDVLNLMGYRMRPYEVEPGTTDAAQARCRDMLVKDFEKGGTILPTLVRCRREFARVKVDRTKLKPKVSVIGEFWAMTTEGDGNYELQRFLESEGAEVDIQPLVNWILYIMWEARWDTHERMELKEHDGGRKGLDKVNVQQKLIGLAAAEKVVRMVWQTYAKAIGLHGHHLPHLLLKRGVAHARRGRAAELAAAVQREAPYVAPMRRERSGGPLRPIVLGEVFRLPTVDVVHLLHRVLRHIMGVITQWHGRTRVFAEHVAAIIPPCIDHRFRRQVPDALGRRRVQAEVGRVVPESS